MKPAPDNSRRLFLIGLCLLAPLVLLAGCGERRLDETKLYKGMDRSAIIAHFGAPDARKSHPPAERFIYKDGEHYQYLLMLIDDKLQYWHHDRVYKANRFSSIRNWSDAEQK